ncbi:hypothetical protein [Streptomyces sp. NPDC059649]|uniref:hypothetical protein n=1 Tax=Streptomyces sp. NPDC059649 TaxID=3346895 RepID=UPI0036B62779
MSLGQLLPTPTAGNPNDGESLESWEARRQRNLAKGINGNGQGTPLNIAVKLLPTPMAGDATGTRNATAGRKTDNPNVNEGWTLSDVVFAGRLSNPAAPRVDGESPSMTQEASALTAVAAPTPHSDVPAKLLPTPRATDGAKGGPNQRGSKGDLMLPSAVSHISNSEPETATSTGASTDQPFDGGSGSSGDGPHGQLMFGDA